MNSQYEDRLAIAIRAQGLPEPVRQWRFAEPHREYRVDFAWPDHRLIVEVDGGAFIGRGGGGSFVSRTIPQGRHQLVSDYRKRNLINLLGYTLLCFQPAQIPLEAIREIEIFLAPRQESLEQDREDRKAYLEKLWEHVALLAQDDARRRRVREVKGRIRKAAAERRRP